MKKRNKVNKIGIVGLGYVGLPLALGFSKYFEVIGFDINKKKIDELNKGIDKTKEFSKKEIKTSNVLFTNDEKKLRECNFIIVSVPTPIKKNKKPDLRFLKSASEIVGRNLKKGSIVVYESTVYPGLTEEFCLPILEKNSGLKCPQNFKIGYSPERINQGDKKHNLENVVKVVSGIDKATTNKIAKIYEKVVKAGVFIAKDIKTAEAAKIIENIQRDVNIALMNELAVVFEKLNINIKEVLKAASTKWNFHNYYPGLVGGHCFSKNSVVFLINSNHYKIKKIGDFVNSLKCEKDMHKGIEIYYPENVKILSYDIKKNKTLFKPIKLATKRKVKEILKIKCAYNYDLEVTKLHPVIVYDKGLKIKLAKDIKKGDKLVLNKILPDGKKKAEIDILEYLPEKDFDKIRVKLKNKSFSSFKKIIDKHFKHLKGKKTNYYTYNYLPLKKYLKIENFLNINRKDIYLCTGRGPSFKKFPCVVKIDKDFSRLIGYYLSEGCITKDKSLRIRFSFNRKEKEYIRDVKTILKKFGLDYSLYEDKKFQSTTLKVSSYIFGFLLKDILKCGTNCYDMQIPDLFFYLSKKHREELLKGLFRGDGGVSWYHGKRRYKKNNKEFRHNTNSIEVSYFSSSPKLFQEVILFLTNFDILPKLNKRKGYLSIFGFKDIEKIKDWFLGEKKTKIDNYLNNIQKRISYKRAKLFKNFIAINVEQIEKIKTDYVYSLEVQDTNTLVTSNGIIAHNCVAVDPYYLIYKSKKAGFKPKLMINARKINEFMPRFVVNKILPWINKGDKVLIMGLAFKENVPDIRNSKAKEIIDLLRKKAKVFAYDPLIKEEWFKKYFLIKRIKDLDKLREIECVIVFSPHRIFKKIDLKKLKKITTKRALLFDIKGFYNKEEAEKKGFRYYSL